MACIRSFLSTSGGHKPILIQYGEDTVEIRAGFSLGVTSDPFTDNCTSSSARREISSLSCLPSPPLSAIPSHSRYCFL
ncbi:hypothetical protein GOBAR_AA33324 [Gossypium barbadense]|uniref:Uncharacterized protein n=1 Tax=Gossypium barbadense TaxID=3634 RepID=A0A2P5W8F8_GOSBA|nr:hypothetical protein GOBAR_AA33324 [Gossypium barbadense]